SALTGKRVLTFGEAAGADVRIHSVSQTGPVTFTVSWQGHDYEIRLQVPGHHNAGNAAGAFAVLVGLGLDPDGIIAGLETFNGTERRFELHAIVRGVSVYDDYS